MIGSISTGTLRPIDLADSFLTHAERLAELSGYQPDIDSLAKLRAELDTLAEDDERLSEIVDSLFDWLGESALPYTYFGAHEGDGADFGFWPCWSSLAELPSYSDFPAELPGEDFTVTNDHGNLSVYDSTGELIWDCV